MSSGAIELYPCINESQIIKSTDDISKLPKRIDATGAFIFAPYHGTPLRELAIQKGYLREDEIASISNTSYSMLRMPSISKKEISGLARTFSFYVKFPESRWDDIKLAEEFTPKGDAMHRKLSDEFDKKYRLSEPTMLDLHD